MMLDWNEYRQQLAGGVREIGQLSPGTVKGYLELGSAGQKTDLLGAKIRELIGLAVAVYAATAALQSTPKPRSATVHRMKRLRKRWAPPSPSMPGQPSSIRHGSWMRSRNIRRID